MHLNDCELPCWIGIRAGETTLEEAKALVKAKYGELQPVSLHDTGYEFGYEVYAVNTESTDYSFYVIFYNEIDFDGKSSPSITLVTFDLNRVPSNHLPLGDLFWLLGDPDSVDANQADFVLLYSQKYHTITALAANTCGSSNTHRLFANQRVIAFTLWDDSIEEIEKTYNATEWRGFTSDCYP